MTDGRTAFATTLVAGFMLLIGIGMFHPIPDENVKTIDSSLAALSAAVGAAVMALLRNDRTDEKRTDNTGRAFDAIAATAKTKPAPQPVKVVNDPSNPVPVEADGGLELTSEMRDRN